MFDITVLMPGQRPRIMHFVADRPVTAGGAIKEAGGDPAAAGAVVTVGGKRADAGTMLRPGDQVGLRPVSDNG